jgi:hypothetical protein
MLTPQEFLSHSCYRTDTPAESVTTDFPLEDDVESNEGSVLVSEHETSFLDKHEAEGCTVASSADDFTDLLLGLDSSNNEELIATAMTSKDYCQAQLVELCNASGARKGFHDDLVRMLKKMKTEHHFDATCCRKRDTFFHSMRGSFPGTPPSSLGVGGTSSGKPDRMSNQRGWCRVC